MAKQRSEKSCYPSRYGGGSVTIAQYITEYLCENIAKANKKDLPTQFWEQEEWAKFFKAQIILLNRMILPYIHPRAVVKALKDWRCNHVTSFGGFVKVPRWTKVLVEHDNLCRAEDAKKVVETPDIDATKQKPARPFGRKSVFSKLRDIDNGESKERQE